MVEYTRMRRYASGHTVLSGLTFLLIIPIVDVTAGNLREEAIGYRIEGYEAQRRGDIAGALSLYQKAAAMDPAYATPHNDIGVLFEEQGRLEAAEQSYRQALTLNPSYLEAHANLAMLYERMGKKEPAIYHWLKRYQLGDPYDPWTARAEERLVGLGVLKTYPGMKGKIFTHRRVIEQELQSFDKSVEEFHAMTEERSDWP